MGSKFLFTGFLAFIFLFYLSLFSLRSKFPFQSGLPVDPLVDEASLRSSLVIEAEEFKKSSHIFGQQEVPRAHGQKILCARFDTPDDFVSYVFVLPDRVEKSNLTFLYATQQEGTSLEVQLDGRFLGGRPCLNTHDWWNFSSLALDGGVLEKGRHRLTIRGKGWINLDAILLIDKEKQSVFWEAEDPTPPVFWLESNDSAIAHGGRIAHINFSPDHPSIDYTFLLDQPMARALLGVTYAAMSPLAQCAILVDGKALGFLERKQETHSDDLSSDGFLLKDLSAGPHVLTLRGTQSIDVDVFYVGRL